jgi:hypothetical protein
MDQHEGSMDDGQGTYWDRGGGDLAPHPPAHLQLLTLKEASNLVRLVEMVICTLVVWPTSQQAMADPEINAYALCNVASQPDLTLYPDPTSPTIPLVSSVAGASWQTVASRAIT